VVNLAVSVQTLCIQGLTAWYIKYEVSLSQSKEQFFLELPNYIGRIGLRQPQLLRKNYFKNWNWGV